MSAQQDNTNKNAPKRNYRPKTAGAQQQSKAEPIEETKEVAKPQQQRDGQNKGGRGGQQN